MCLRFSLLICCQNNRSIVQTKSTNIDDRSYKFDPFLTILMTLHMTVVLVKIAKIFIFATVVWYFTISTIYRFGMRFIFVCAWQHQFNQLVYNKRIYLTRVLVIFRPLIMTHWLSPHRSNNWLCSSSLVIRWIISILYCEFLCVFSVFFSLTVNPFIRCDCVCCV